MKMRHLLLLGMSAVFMALLPVRVASAARVYHVSTSGCDDNLGSQAAPLRTIGAAVGRASAGDLVVAAAGVYREAVALTRAGSSVAPIIVRGLPGAVITSPDPCASLSAFDIASSVSFVAIQGFELTGGFAESVFVRPGAHDIELAGLHVHHNRTGIWIAGASDVVVRDTILDHNYRTGVRIFAGAQRIHIIDSRSEANDDGEGCSGDSDGFNADATTSDVSFERATAIGNSEDGFDVQGPNTTLLQVAAHDNGCSGVKLTGSAYMENVLVERSHIGVNVNPPAGATTVVQNCTLSQNDIGLRVIGRGHTVVVRNSVITGPGKAIQFPSTVQLFEDHNLLDRPDAKDRLIVCEDAGAEVLYTGNDLNAGRWQRESGQGAGTVYAHADLDPETCRLQAGSVAIDTGGACGSVPVDLDGMPRPAGCAIDRGAFEWSSATPTLRVLRGVLHWDGMGRGPVRMRAEMDLPAGGTFDPLTDTATIELRGTRGVVQRIELPAGGFRSSRSSQGTLLRARRVAASGQSTHVTLYMRPGHATLRLMARAADAWAADADGIDLTVELGRMRARTHEPARQVGQTLYFLPN